MNKQIKLTCTRLHARKNKPKQIADLSVPHFLPLYTYTTYL